jgi:hypothetical protein
MKTHRVRIENPSTREIIQEVRYKNGLLYRQNRSYDVEICFDDFLDRCKISKEKACKQKLNMVCDMVEDNTLWNESITA